MKRYLNEYWPYLLALFPAMLFRDFTPSSELRYVSLATELINNSSNHFFCLEWQGQSFPYIMPLYVWLIALLKVIFQHHYMLTITFLFSFLPSMVILTVMNRWVERYDTKSFRLVDGSQSRILASIMLLTCGLQLGMSFFVSPEMFFAMWVVLALYTFWRIINHRGAYGQPLSDDIKHRGRLQALFGLYVFLAVFTKGPLGFTIPFLATTFYLAVSGRMRQWALVWNWRAWLVMLAPFALWVYLTYLEGGYEWVKSMFLDIPAETFLEPKDHDRPLWYYLVSIWGVTLPWGPVCIVVLIISLIRRIHHKVFHWRKPFDTSLQNFFVSTFVLLLLYFSVRRFKLDANLVPVFPFLIYAGVMQLGQWRWPVRWNWPFIWICRGVLVLVFVAGCLSPWLNINIGCYGRVCYRCNRLSRELKTENTYVYKLRRIQGMDAYLHEDPIDANAEDIAAGKLRNTLLILKEYRLEKLRKELTEMGVPAEKQGTVVSEIGAYVILHFE